MAWETPCLKCCFSLSKDQKQTRLTQQLLASGHVYLPISKLIKSRMYTRLTSCSTMKHRTYPKHRKRSRQRRAIWESQCRYTSPPAHKDRTRNFPVSGESCRRWARRPWIWHFSGALQQNQELHTSKIVQRLIFNQRCLQHESRLRWLQYADIA